MSNEDLTGMFYQLEALELHIKDLQNVESTLVRGLRDATNAINAIKGLDKEQEILIPLGSGAFLKVRMLPDSKFVVNVGGGVAVEKDSDATINFLEQMIKGAEVNLQNTMVEKNRAEAGRVEIKRQIYRSADKVPNEVKK